MKEINKRYIWIRQYLNGRIGYLIFLLLLIGTLIGGYSINESINIYYNINEILHNNYFIVLVFIAMGLIIIKLNYDMLNNSNYILRIGSSFNFIKDINKKILITEFIIYSIIVLLVVSMSLIFCLGNPGFFYNNFYMLLLYNLWSFTVLFLYLHILNRIFSSFLLYFDTRKHNIIVTLYIIFIFVSMFICPQISVKEFFDIPIMFIWCFNSNVIYNSFFLEMFCLSLHFCILAIIYEIELRLIKKFDWRYL